MKPLDQYKPNLAGMALGSDHYKLYPIGLKYMAIVTKNWEFLTWVNQLYLKPKSTNILTANDIIRSSLTYILGIFLVVFILLTNMEIRHTITEAKMQFKSPLKLLN